MKPNIDYGAELLVELAAKGITQVELAEELGKTKDTVVRPCSDSASQTMKSPLSLLTSSSTTREAVPTSIPRHLKVAQSPHRARRAPYLPMTHISALRFRTSPTLAR